MRSCRAPACHPAQRAPLSGLAVLFRSAICDCLSLHVSVSRSLAGGRRVVCGLRAVAMKRRLSLPRGPPLVLSGHAASLPPVLIGHVGPRRAARGSKRFTRAAGRWDGARGAGRGAGVRREVNVEGGEDVGDARGLDLPALARVLRAKALAFMDSCHGTRTPPPPFLY
jgi:hypothetical protein